MANIGVVPRNIFPSSTGYPIDITFSKTTWDSEGIPTTELKVSNTNREDFYATIGLCYEDEEVELFRLCTQRFDIYWF